MKLRFKYEFIQDAIKPKLPTLSKDGCPCELCRDMKKDEYAIALAKYEQDNKDLNKDVKKRGMLVFESEPQVRTLFTNDNKGTHRVPFPYFINVICYSLKNNIYKYGGIYDSGLRVFFRNSPMTSFSDEVFLPPTDANRFGLVCTPHEHDRTTFKTLEELVNHVITLWWHTVHHFEYEDRWDKMTLEQAVSNKWRPTGKFPDALRKTIESGYGRDNSFYPPEDSVLIDEVWPPISPPALPFDIPPSLPDTYRARRVAGRSRALFLSRPDRRKPPDRVRGGC